jgi:serine/threonine-protein kinase RsbW
MLVDKGALVISLAGDITWQNASALRERLSLIIQQGYTSLILNVEAVGYVDSSGLAVLISFSRRLQAKGGRLVLMSASEAVVRAIRQAGVIDKIPCIPKGLAGVRSVGVPADEEPLRVYTVSLSRDPSSMEQARKSIASILQALQLPRSTAYDLVLALGEALGNAFDHGGGSEGEEGDVSATVSVYSDRLVMEVNDCGAGIAYNQGDELPEPTNERGRGIKLMLMLADSISIFPRESGRGTCVRLVKMLNLGAQAGA